MKVLAPDHYPWLALDTNHLAGKPPLSELQDPNVVMLIGLSKPYKYNIRALALIVDGDDPGWYLVDTAVETQIDHRLKAFGRFQRDLIPARHAYLERVPQLKDPGVLPITAAWAWWSPNRYANTPVWLSYPQVIIVGFERPARLTVKLKDLGSTLTLTQMPVIADLKQWRLLEAHLCQMQAVVAPVAEAEARSLAAAQGVAAHFPKGTPYIHDLPRPPLTIESLPYVIANFLYDQRLSMRQLLAFLD